MGSYNYSTACVQVRATGRVAVANVRGIVTQASAGKIIADSAGWCGRLGLPLASVVVYRDAAVAIQADELLKAASGAYRQGAGLAAAALVVSSDQFALFRDYARMSAERGVLKAVFLSVDDAHCWAARQAGVAEEWAQMRAALRSAP